MIFAKWEEIYNKNMTSMIQISNLLDDKAKLESKGGQNIRLDLT